MTDKPTAARARAMVERENAKREKSPPPAADGEAPPPVIEVVAEKLGVRPSVVTRALARTGYRGRPRARGVPVRLRLPAEVIAAADARVSPGKDRNAVLAEALAAALLPAGKPRRTG